MKESRIWGILLLAMIMYLTYCMYSYSKKIDQAIENQRIGTLKTKTVEAPTYNNSVEGKLIQ